LKAEEVKNMKASFDNVFLGNFLLLAKEVKALTNNFKHKTLVFNQKAKYSL